MRPIRSLILLLAVALAIVLALFRPLQGRAGRAAAVPVSRHEGLEPRRRRHLMSLAPDDGAATFGLRVVAYARRFLGAPYSWGGISPRTGFDCSGLVRFVYGHFGVSLPHSSFADLGLGHRVSRSRLRPGDLVFFADASHVGIYAGDDRFIEAPHSGSVVRLSSMRLFGASFYAGRRLPRSSR